MRVTYDGDPATLSTALEARGFEVSGGGSSIRIRRAAGQPAAPRLPTPAVPTDMRPAE